MAVFARGAGPWLGLPAAACAAFVMMWRLQANDAYLWGAAACLLPLAFFAWFFRDPDRIASPTGLASPADGTVVIMDDVEDADVGRAQRLAIFMSPLDVHVNRVPMDGTVVSVTRKPGGFVPAFKKESERNERVETLLETAHGKVKVIQIAGTVARRIVPYLEPGQKVRKGDRLGLIRLGSRCDLLVPFRVTWTPTLRAHVNGGADNIGVPA